MNGIIPLFKPRGLTSFQCVGKIRKILQVRKAGHSGTLDPDVDGVLPICVGSATKVASYLMRFGKVYRGKVTFGFSTTTEDLAGDRVKTLRLARPYSRVQIRSKMKELTSKHLVQIPPMYSAVRVNGRHLYEYARKGVKVKRPHRVVQVNAFEQTCPASFDASKGLQTISFEVRCGKGTYVRTLATSLGRKLGCPAVMSSLTRVKSGNFTLKQTVTFSQIRTAIKHHRINRILFSIDHALPDVKHFNLSNDQWHRVQNGAFLYHDDIPQKMPRIILKYGNDDKALYQYDRQRKCYRPLKMFSIK